MAYLIIKMAALLLLAALLGFFFGWWWIRRQFVEVTDTPSVAADTTTPRDLTPKFASIESSVRRLGANVDGIAKSINDHLRKELSARFEVLGNRLASLERKQPRVEGGGFEPVDLGSIDERLASLESSIRSLAKLTERNFATFETRIQNIDRGLFDMRPTETSKPQKPVDLSPIYANVERLEAKIDKIRPPAPVDLSPLELRIDSVHRAVDSIRIPEPTPQVDLAPVEDRLLDIESALEFRALKKQIAAVESNLKAQIQPDADDSIDFAPVLNRLSKLEKSLEKLPASQDVTSIGLKVDEIDAGVRQLRSAPSVDLAPVHARLSAIDQLVRGMKIPDAVDITPVLSQLGLIDEVVRGIRMPKNTDLSPALSRLAAIESQLQNLPSSSSSLEIHTVEARLTALEERLPTADEWVQLDQRLDRLEALLGQAIATTAPDPTPVEHVAPGTAPLLLEASEYGPKDNLKRISGVGPVLEGILNRLGVWYFWQIARWSDEEVAYVDRHLQSFKGRILRDKWVEQSRGFAEESDSRPPESVGGAQFGLSPHAGEEPVPNDSVNSD